MNKIKCPACNGCGFIKPVKPKNRIKDEGGKMSTSAKRLSKKGYTLREIADMLGYKHPQSIQHLLDKK